MANEEKNLSAQLADIQRTLGMHTGLLEGLNKKGEETRENFRDLWKSQRGQDKQIAQLETKAKFWGAIAGTIVAGLIAGIRWFAGK